MTLLIDTHCWLWWLTEPEKLSDTAVAILKNTDNTILFSAVSSWEIAIKYSLNKLPLPEPPDRFVPSRIEREGFATLPIHHAHALKTASLPHHHKDPFDRLLIAQSMVEAVPIMTADPTFDLYDVDVIVG